MQKSNLIPTKNRIIVQIFEPELALIKTDAATKVDPRAKVQILAVGPDVQPPLIPGAFVLLQPDANILCPKSGEFGMEGKIGTIYDTVVIAVIQEPVAEASYPPMTVLPLN